MKDKTFYTIGMIIFVIGIGFSVFQPEQRSTLIICCTGYLSCLINSHEEKK